MKRVWYYDFLRIAACFSVIMLHSASQYWYSLPTQDTRWVVANSYDALFRFGVPVFVMISGALLLDPTREITLKKLYTHNILRLISAYFFWSLLYAVWYFRTLSAEERTIPDLVREILLGRYHMWFVPMIIGIYLLLPLLRTWISHASWHQIEYFLLLFLVFQIIRMTVIAFTSSDMVREVMELLPVEMAQSYLGYFVLGYYLAHREWKPSVCRWCLPTGIAAMAGAAFFSNYLTMTRGGTYTAVYDSYSLFTFLVSASLFLFFRQMLEGRQLRPGVEKLVNEISACTFGIYLLHILMLEVLKNVGLDSMTVNNLIGIPLLAVVCFLLCLGAVMVLRRLPFVGKYIC